MLHEDVVKLIDAYKDYRGLLSEFVSDVLTLIDAQDLSSLWVESYSKPEPRVGITPIKNDKVGQMIWVPPIEDFDQILAFLRHKDINLFRVPGNSVGRIDGIQFIEPDFVTLRILKPLLASDS